MKIHCSYDELVDIKDLKPNELNPNIHSKKQIEMLANVIKETGWRSPIVISLLSNKIVKGHGRYEAAKLLNLKKVPVDYQDYENEAQEEADLLADNRIPELSSFDDFKLLNKLEDIRELDIDFELTGFSEDDFEKLKNNIDKTGLKEEIDNNGKGKENINKEIVIRPCININRVDILEKALRLTGEKNRGIAFCKICEEYIESKEKGQFDIKLESFIKK